MVKGTDLNVFKNITAKEEVLKSIYESQEMKREYEHLSMDIQKKFLEFCMGMKGLPLSYDPFFKKIFDPEIYPERLSRLLTLILGMEVKVKHVLMNEGTRILEEGTLLIMDIVVELTDGSIANVEIQKMAYLFPGERAACYSSDLLMRQYSKVKNEKGKTFSYKDIKKVYTIILLEKSTSLYKKFPNLFIHKFKQGSDSGIQIELLQEYVFISLDIFKKIKHNKLEEELDAWLHCISSEEPEVIYHIIERYPQFISIYEDVEAFRADIGGVLSMFSEALRILDKNTVQYMIDELQEELKEEKKKAEEKEELLCAKDKRIKELEEILAKQNEKVTIQQH